MKDCVKKSAACNRLMKASRRTAGILVSSCFPRLYDVRCASPQVCDSGRWRRSVPADGERTGRPPAGQRLHETACVPCPEGQSLTATSERALFDLPTEHRSSFTRQTPFIQAREQEALLMDANIIAERVQECVTFPCSSKQTDLWFFFFYFFFPPLLLQEISEYYIKHAHSAQRWHTPKIMEDLKVCSDILGLHFV